MSSSILSAKLVTNKPLIIKAAIMLGKEWKLYCVDWRDDEEINHLTIRNSNGQKISTLPLPVSCTRNQIALTALDRTIYLGIIDGAAATIYELFYDRTDWDKRCTIPCSVNEFPNLHVYDNDIFVLTCGDTYFGTFKDGVKMTFTGYEFSEAFYTGENVILILQNRQIIVPCYGSNSKFDLVEQEKFQAIMTALVVEEAKERLCNIEMNCFKHWETWNKVKMGQYNHDDCQIIQDEIEKLQIPFEERVSNCPLEFDHYGSSINYSQYLYMVDRQGKVHDVEITFPEAKIINDGYYTEFLGKSSGKFLIGFFTHCGDRSYVVALSTYTARMK